MATGADDYIVSAMSVFDVNDSTFEQEVLASELPVLIDLYADWCGPCKQLSPLVEELARELDGKLKVVKIDVDKSPMVAQAFRVQSIPMLVVVHEGRPVQQHMGLLDKNGLMKLVEPFLPRSGNSVKPEELAQLIAQRRALPVDIRDENSFSRYRIPTAQNVPVDKLSSETQKLAPTDGRVRVLYGRTTDEAKEAAEAAQQMGVQVAYLEGGFLHWEADGLDVERG